MSGHQDENGWLDPRLRAQLRAALPEPPIDEVDWEGLRERIAGSADPYLARLRTGGRARAAVWWEYAARWAAPVLPAALAAAAALALLLGRLERSTPTPATVVATTRAPETSGTQASVLEAALSGSTSTVLVAAADPDALLRAAVNP